MVCPPGDGHTILAIKQGAFTALMFLDGPHGLTGTGDIVVSGNSISSFNTTWTFSVGSQPANVLSISRGVSSNSSGFGGSWELPP